MRKKLQKGILLLVSLFFLYPNSKIFAAEDPVIYNSYAEKNNLQIYVGNVNDIQNVGCQIGNIRCEDVSVNSQISMESYILIDNSLSIDSKYRETIGQILQTLIDTKGENETITLATIDQKLHYLVQKSTDGEQLKQLVKGIVYEDLDTKVTDVIYSLCKELEAQPFDGFRRIVLISDGAEFSSVGFTRQEMLDEVEKLSYPIYTIGCTYKDNTKELEDMFSLSRMTGAEPIWLDEENDVQKIVNTINNCHNAIEVNVTIPDQLGDGTKKGVKLDFQTTEGEVSASSEMEMPFIEIDKTLDSEAEAAEAVSEADSHEEKRDEPMEAAEISEAAEEKEEPTEAAEISETAEEKEEPAKAAEISETLEEKEEPAKAAEISETAEEKEEPAKAAEISETLEEKEEPAKAAEISETAEEKEEPTEAAEISETAEEKEEPTKAAQISEAAGEKEEPTKALELTEETEKQKEMGEEKSEMVSEDPITQLALIGIVVLLVIFLIARIIKKRKKNSNIKEGTVYSDVSGDLPTEFNSTGAVNDSELPTEMWGEEETMFPDDEKTMLLDEEGTEVSSNTEARIYDFVSIRFTDIENPVRMVEVPLSTVVSIGRNAQKNQVVFDYEKSVSAQHCEIFRMNGKIYIRDLRSSNGTYVDGIQVEEAELYSGAILKLGRLEVKFEVV